MELLISDMLLVGLAGNEHLGGKMEVPGAYGLYHHAEDFGMSG